MDFNLLHCKVCPCHDTQQSPVFEPEECGGLVAPGRSFRTGAPEQGTSSQWICDVDYEGLVRTSNQTALPILAYMAVQIRQSGAFTESNKNASAPEKLVGLATMMQAFVFSLPAYLS